MSTELRKEMHEYSNKDIIEILKYPQYNSKIMVEIAKEISLEREILNNENIQSIKEKYDKRFKRIQSNSCVKAFAAFVAILAFIRVIIKLIKFSTNISNM
jgi:hypothetical protein